MNRMYCLIVATACLNTGCGSHTELGTYETARGDIRVTLLDPNECDQSRTIVCQVEGVVSSSSNIKVLSYSCSLKPRRHDFILLDEDDDHWCAFCLAPIEGSPPGPEDIVFMIDRRRGTLVTDKSDFPPTITQLTINRLVSSN
jgi:hypothetical protein